MQMNTSVAPALSTPPVNMPAVPMPSAALSGIHQRLNAMRAPVAGRPDIDPRMLGGPRMRWNAAGVQTHAILGQYAVRREAARDGSMRLPMVPPRLARGSEDSMRQSMSRRIVRSVINSGHTPTARFVNNVATGNVKDADFDAAQARLVRDLSALMKSETAKAPADRRRRATAIRTNRAAEQASERRASSDNCRIARRSQEL